MAITTMNLPSAKISINRYVLNTEDRTKDVSLTLESTKVETYACLLQYENYNAYALWNYLRSSGLYRYSEQIHTTYTSTIRVAMDSSAYVYSNHYTHLVTLWSIIRVLQEDIPYCAYTSCDLYIYKVPDYTNQDLVIHLDIEYYFNLQKVYIIFRTPASGTYDFAIRDSLVSSLNVAIQLEVCPFTIARCSNDAIFITYN